MPADIRRFLVAVDPRLLTALLSACATLMALAGSELPNTDGVLYLRAAEAYADGGFSAAQALHDNPYYSILIALVSQWLGLQAIHAAYLINTLICAAIGWLMADLGNMIGGNRAAAYCTGALLLLHPQFNEYRTFIIRDFAFWCCLLGYFDLQLRFYLTLRGQCQIGAVALLLIGALFRVESVLLLALPLLNLIILRDHISIVRKTLQLYAGILAVVVLLTALVMSGLLVDPDSLTHPTQRFLAIGSRFQHTLLGHEQAFRDHLLIGYLEEYALAGVVAAFVTIVFLKALNTFTLPYFIVSMALVPTMQRVTLSKVRTAATTTFVIYYSLILVAFMLGTTIIQGRYAIPLTLAALPVLGSYLEYWPFIQKAFAHHKRAKSKLIMGTFVCYLLIDSFISFGPRKTYLYDSINWLQSLPNHCTLITNNTKVGYFSGKATDWRQSELLIARPLTYLPTRSSDVVAIEFRRDEAQNKALAAALDRHFAQSKSFETGKWGIHIFYNPRTGPSCQSPESTPP